MSRRDRMRSPWLATLPHFPWTLTCLALLIAGGFLENSAAQTHRIPVEDLIDHDSASLLVPVFFLGVSMLCGLGPGLGEAWLALRRGRVSWLLVAAAVIVGIFCVGHFAESAAASLVMSVWLNYRARLSTSAEKSRKA
ncbi:MAG: hypothetical protein KAY59_00120 [Acidobacteria bacterium]|nr:hypothetical protein [Acidobacteriota bacterium]